MRMNRSDDEQQQEEQEEQQQQEEEEEERPVSIYNDCQGIKYTVNFQPLPIRTSKGRMKKAATLGRTLFVHEDEHFAKVLSEALAGVGKTNANFRVVGANLRTTAFSVTYTIPYTSTKNQQLLTTSDFKNALDDAKKKGSPTIRLDFEELTPPADKENDPAPEIDERPAKKTCTLTPEEQAIKERVQQLSGEWSCSDDKCDSRICFVLPNGMHIRLTPKELKLWASLWEAGMEGVDIKNPPKDKVFRAPNTAPDTATDDINLLASRRLNALRNANQPTGVVVNNDFTGLGTAIGAALQLFNRDGAAPAPAPLAQAPPAPDMSMEQFCRAAGIEHLYPQLAPLKLSGPHVLAYVDNTDLDKVLGLVGERAELRHREGQWKAGKIQL
ncbi:hypothetical protein C8F01DRAFT_1143687 [Mycena amicta]|nr:hypothetical protein C8F01DRAFT_1143687 [Mycena amicta]